MVDESKEDLMAAYKLDPSNKAVRKELQLLKVSRECELIYSIDSTSCLDLNRPALPSDPPFQSLTMDSSCCVSRMFPSNIGVCSRCCPCILRGKCTVVSY